MFLWLVATSPCLAKGKSLPDDIVVIKRSDSNDHLLRLFQKHPSMQGTKHPFVFTKDKVIYINLSEKIDIKDKKILGKSEIIAAGLIRFVNRKSKLVQINLDNYDAEFCGTFDSLSKVKKFFRISSASAILNQATLVLQKNPHPSCLKELPPKSNRPELNGP